MTGMGLVEHVVTFSLDKIDNAQTDAQKQTRVPVLTKVWNKISFTSEKHDKVSLILEEKIAIYILRHCALNSYVF